MSSYCKAVSKSVSFRRGYHSIPSNTVYQRASWCQRISNSLLIGENSSKKRLPELIRWETHCRLRTSFDQSLLFRGCMVESTTMLSTLDTHFLIYGHPQTAHENNKQYRMMSDSNADISGVSGCMCSSLSAQISDRPKTRWLLDKSQMISLQPWSQVFPV